jgi:hypothetical protein
MTIVFLMVVLTVHVKMEVSAQWKLMDGLVHVNQASLDRGVKMELIRAPVIHVKMKERVLM